MKYDKYYSIPVQSIKHILLKYLVFNTYINYTLSIMSNLHSHINLYYIIVFNDNSIKYNIDIVCIYWISHGYWM